MATPDDVLSGVAAAMEDAVPDLTTALDREADVTDNRVEFPHGDITIVSNIRADQWNTDFVGYATDDQNNQIGYIIDAKFDAELQLNIWLGVPSTEHNIQALGGQLERGMRRYDASRKYPDTLPDGSGGSLDDATNFRIIDGGDLPIEEGTQPPMRGYAITVSLRFTDRINTAEEYGESEYIVHVDHPGDGDLNDGDPDDIAIEYIAT